MRITFAEPSTTTTHSEITHTLSTNGYHHPRAPLLPSSRNERSWRGKRRGDEVAPRSRPVRNRSLPEKYLNIARVFVPRPENRNFLHARAGSQWRKGMASNRATKSGFAAEAQRKVSFREQVVVDTTWPVGWFVTGRQVFGFFFCCFGGEGRKRRKPCWPFLVCLESVSAGEIDSSLGYKGGSDSRSYVLVKLCERYD